MASVVSPDSTEFQQQQADAYGISLSDYQALLAQYPPVWTANSQGGQYGMSAGGSYGQNPELTQTLQTLQLIQKYGGNQAQAAPQTGTLNTSQSYLTGAAPTTQSTSMASIASPTTGQAQVTPQQAQYYYLATHGSAAPDDATAMSYFTTQNPSFGASGVSTQNAINWAVQQGINANVDPATAVAMYEQAHPDQVQAGVAQAALTPEQRALQQQAQTDPVSENLRNQLAASYTDPAAAAHPDASQYQSYLDTFKQVDPEEYAQRQGLATSMDSYLKSVQDQYALGSQLDPVTAMQVQQAARQGQADRGNLYGSGQAAVEAMTTGQAGQALLQQRQAALSSALGQQQGYLGAGLGLGDTAMQLYQQGQQNKANAQQSALSYLTSGATPYQTGASYLNQANANAATAAQGGPVYNPASLGAGNLGTAQQAPQYGLDIGNQSQNYFNSLNNAYGGGATGSTKNQAVSAATGALSGAAAGATAGSVVPGYGTVIGGAVGAIAGGLGGYYS
jgi:hypothetical protein